MTLIQRLEQAAEGSRELDAEIGNHICSPELLAEYEEWGGPPVPEYTTSLDAALTLVPKGWEWNVNGTSVMTFARVANEGLIHEPSFCKHTGPNRAALNLSIVALKAIEDIRARSSDR